jgi:hypothetical protein
VTIMRCVLNAIVVCVVLGLCALNGIVACVVLGLCAHNAIVVCCSWPALVLFLACVCP